MNNSNIIRVVNENGKEFEYGQIPDGYQVADYIADNCDATLGDQKASEIVRHLWHMAHHLKAAIEQQEQARIVSPQQPVPAHPGTLPNGARIIAIDFDECIILAESDHDFVTWAFNTEQGLGSTVSGHYFGDDIEAARDDFEARVKRGY
jgi:hypothetical protein